MSLNFLPIVQVFGILTFCFLWSFAKGSNTKLSVLPIMEAFAILTFENNCTKWLKIWELKKEDGRQGQDS